MKILFPYALLIPAFVILGMLAASLFGYEPFPINASSALLGASWWFLIFLIFHGGVRGWRSVRVFIFLFILLNFGSIFYRQLVQDLAWYEIGLDLAAAAIISALFCAVFWPQTPRKKGYLRSEPEE